MSAHTLDVFTALTGARETATAENGFHPERRRRARTNVHWRVLLRFRSRETVDTVTENLSSSGFYCLCPKPLEPGESILSVLLVPAHDPNGDERTLALECTVRIMRAETARDGLFGIACRIEDYHLVTDAMHS
jgi:hypothetical protein